MNFASAKVYELGIGVPMWNVVRLIIVSMSMAAVVSKSWALGIAYRAGNVMARGGRVRLEPRSLTRGSLVVVADGNDMWVSRLVLVATGALLIADFLIEFGSGSVDIPTRARHRTGYSGAGFRTPLYAGMKAGGSWVPTKRLSRDFSTTYEVGEVNVDNLVEAGFEQSHVEELVAITKVTFSGGQSLVSSNAKEWVLTGGTDMPWFLGIVGAAMLNEPFVLFCDALECYLLKERNWKGSPSIAVAEMVTSLQFRSSVWEAVKHGYILEMQMFEKPVVTINCGQETAYPADWKVECVEPGVGPARILRHDRHVTPAGLNPMRLFAIEVDFGEPTEAGIPWNDVDKVSVQLGGFDNQQLVKIVYAGGNFTMFMTESVGVLIKWAGEIGTVCVQITGALRTEGEVICRRKEWQAEELSLVVKSLILTLSNVENVWPLINEWRDRGRGTTQTRLAWISGTIDDTRAEYLNEFKTEATVNLAFIAGVWLITMVLLVGVLLAIVSWWPNRNSPKSVQSVTMHST